MYCTLIKHSGHLRTLEKYWLVPSRPSVSEGSGSQLGETNEARDDGKEKGKGERDDGTGRLRVEKLDNESKSWQRSFSFDFFFISMHSDLSNEWIR